MSLCSISVDQPTRPDRFQSSPTEMHPGMLGTDLIHYALSIYLCSRACIFHVLSTSAFILLDSRYLYLYLTLLTLLTSPPSVILLFISLLVSMLFFINHCDFPIARSALYLFNYSMSYFFTYPNQWFSPNQSAWSLCGVVFV